MKSVSKMMRLSGKEVQLGQTKIFIRQPEMYFELERLREGVFHQFAEAIQRAWRRFASRKHFVKLRRNVSKFVTQHKSRRRESVLRPYHGLYLRDHAWQSGISETLASAMDMCKGVEALKTRDAHPRWRFTDTAYLLAKPTELVVSLPGGTVAATDFSVDTDARTRAPTVALVPCAVAVSDRAIYVFDSARSAHGLTMNPMSARGGGGGGGEDGDVAVEEPHKLRLRREILLTDITHASLSPNADDVIVLRMKPQEFPTAPVQDHWVPNKSVAVRKHLHPPTHTSHTYAPLTYHICTHAHITGP